MYKKNLLIYVFIISIGIFVKYFTGLENENVHFLKFISKNGNEYKIKINFKNNYDDLISEWQENCKFRESERELDYPLAFGKNVSFLRVEFERTKNKVVGSMHSIKCYFEDRTELEMMKRSLKFRRISNVFVTRNGFPIDLERDEKIKCFNKIIAYTADEFCPDHLLFTDRNYFPRTQLDYPSMTRSNLDASFNRVIGLNEDQNYEYFHIGGYCLIYKESSIIGVIGNDGLHDRVDKIRYDENFPRFKVEVQRN